LEETPIAEGLDQKVAASIVLEDLHAATAGDASGMQEVQGIVGADVDLVSGFAGGDRKDVAEIEGRGTAISRLMEGVDLLRPARIAGQPPVFGIDEGLR